MLNVIDCLPIPYTSLQQQQQQQQQQILLKMG